MNKKKNNSITSNTTSNSFSWIDVPIVDGIETNQTKLKPQQQQTQSIEEYDHKLVEVFDSLPAKSMLIVATQGDISSLKRLVARKQRTKWEISSAKLTLSIAGTKMSQWTEADEVNLTRLAADVARGSLFFRIK